ncbi:MAG TPA: hypothetical protein VMW72_18665 [Sedimentisphaerales bacterium]|nr:hypothetical protein [Sedimentisphaerales bacterium]
MLYLASALSENTCPELVEGVDFIKGFCLAVVGKPALSLPKGRHPNACPSISLAEVNGCRGLWAELYFLPWMFIPGISFLACRAYP